MIGVPTLADPFLPGEPGLPIMGFRAFDDHDYRHHLYRRAWRIHTPKRRVAAVDWTPTWLPIKEPRAVDP